MSLVFGLFLYAVAIVLMLESRLGLSPWDVLHQGIARHTPLTFGLASVAVGVGVLVVAWALGGRPGIGTLANATLIGLYIQGLTSIHWVGELSHSSLALRVVCSSWGSRSPDLPARSTSAPISEPGRGTR